MGKTFTTAKKKRYHEPTPEMALLQEDAHLAGKHRGSPNPTYCYPCRYLERDHKKRRHDGTPNEDCYFCIKQAAFDEIAASLKPSDTVPRGFK